MNDWDEEPESSNQREDNASTSKIEYTEESLPEEQMFFAEEEHVTHHSRSKWDNSIIYTTVASIL